MFHVENLKHWRKFPDHKLKKKKKNLINIFVLKLKVYWELKDVAQDFLAKLILIPKIITVNSALCFETDGLPWIDIMLHQAAQNS